MLRTISNRSFSKSMSFLFKGGLLFVWKPYVSFLTFFLIFLILTARLWCFSYRSIATKTKTNTRYLRTFFRMIVMCYLNFMKLSWRENPRFWRGGWEKSWCSTRTWSSGQKRNYAQTPTHASWSQPICQNVQSYHGTGSKFNQGHETCTQIWQETY